MVELNCWILDESDRPFPVEVPHGGRVSSLQQEIINVKQSVLSGLGGNELGIWKVSIPVTKDLKSEITRMNFRFEDELLVTAIVSNAIPDPVPGHIHIVVGAPEDFFKRKRRRLDIEAPQKEGIQSEPEYPPRIHTKEEMESKLANAFEPFEEYIKCLASGKLDGYLDSIRREDKFKVSGVYLPNDPYLLIHDLGMNVDMKRIKNLFIHDTVHLFDVSGSGKTRLALDGLCHNWGVYISCRSSLNSTSGSNDFEQAAMILQGMSSWRAREANPGNAAAAANCIFLMLLCARFFVLKQLVRYLPDDTDPVVARRRWVFAQVLPPRTWGGDIFVHMFLSLWDGRTDLLHSFILSTLSALKIRRPGLFPEGYTPLFCVIDEAQVAADLVKYFPSSTGESLRLVLREMYNSFDKTGIFAGILLAGTGLSVSTVTRWMGACSAKYMPNAQPLVFTDIGRFRTGDPSQVEYIRKYLSFSDNESDRQLLQRIVYWFSGRHRLTASLVELLLWEGSPVPRHRVLTSFIERLTGFKITDATELEDGEPDIPLELSKKIGSYGPIQQLNLLLRRNDLPLLSGPSEDPMELISCLIDVLRRWTVASESTLVPIEHNMHDIISLGLGFLNLDREETWSFKSQLTYPVYLSEPLVVLSLASVFEDQTWSNRQQGLMRSLRLAPNMGSLGFSFEEVALFALMDAFGGKPRPLSEVFECNNTLGSRKVTLVSLKRGVDCTMLVHPVSWISGSSDRFAFKAKSPNDVLTFFNDPEGKAFLFPDTHAGPDLFCFVQDEESKELILLAVQAKVSPKVSSETWISALNSVTPDFFYTIMKDGKRNQYYAPASCANLIDDLKDTWKGILGSEEYGYESIAETHHRLRGHTQSDSDPTRQTPRFLGVVASPDQPGPATRQGWKRCHAFLKWDVVKRYVGSTADLMKFERLGGKE